jgi:hypothetical protein
MFRHRIAGQDTTAMATMTELLDRCVSASPQDGILAATTFRVLKQEADKPRTPAAEDDDDEAYAPWAHPGRTSRATRSLWVIAIGELA